MMHRAPPEQLTPRRREFAWLWVIQAAVALILFCLLTGLWAYLWLSSGFWT